MKNVTYHLVQKIYGDAFEIHVTVVEFKREMSCKQTKVDCVHKKHFWHILNFLYVEFIPSAKLQNGQIYTSKAGSKMWKLSIVGIKIWANTNQL